MTQESLAEAAGLDRTEIVRLETGARKGTAGRVVLGLARALDVQPDVILSAVQQDASPEQLARAFKVPVEVLRRATS
jgi:transcriptional regulator with XRE-family HTH domain